MGFSMNQDGIKRSLFDILAFPQMSWSQLSEKYPYLSNTRADVVRQIEIQAQYKGYIDRQKTDIAQFQKDESLKIPAEFPYDAVGGLSCEVMSKLQRIKPATIGAALRIPGVTPAAATAILTKMKK
jgi:tRNA uridine 5-carboxymethylaminomethyl modification enzyme